MEVRIIHIVDTQTNCCKGGGEWVHEIYLTLSDPIAFRLELLKRAEENPVGEANDYDFWPVALEEVIAVFNLTVIRFVGLRNVGFHRDYFT